MDGVMWERKGHTLGFVGVTCESPTLSSASRVLPHREPTGKMDRAY